jgi:hypothetical protein
MSPPISVPSAAAVTMNKGYMEDEFFHLILYNLSNLVVNLKGKLIKLFQFDVILKNISKLSCNNYSIYL